MNTRLITLLIGLAALTLSSSAYAETPCESLKGAEAKRYNELGDAAADRYGAKDYPGAIEAILEIKSICSEDPRLDYNLARSYHRSENCNMARFWYEEVLARSEDSLGKELKGIIKKQKQRALKSITELEQICSNSTRVAFSCADEGVVIRLGETIEAACPSASRLDSGDYLLVASREGHDSFEMNVKLKPGSDVDLFVPKLLETRAKATTGTVKLSCDKEITTVNVQAPDLSSTTWPCPSTQQAAPGDYTLTIPGHDVTEVVAVELGETASVRLGITTIEQDPIIFAPDDDLRIGAWTSLGVGSAMLVTGLVMHAIALDYFTDVTIPGDINYTNGVNPVVSGTTEAEARASLDTAQTLDTTAWVVVGVGGAAIATGVILLLLSDPDETPLPGVSVGASKDNITLSFGGHF